MESVIPFHNDSTDTFFLIIYEVFQGQCQYNKKYIFVSWLINRGQIEVIISAYLIVTNYFRQYFML